MVPEKLSSSCDSFCGVLHFAFQPILSLCGEQWSGSEMTEEREAEKRNQPVCLSDLFAGESSLEDWCTHFETVAASNNWNEAEKLKWMIVWLTGNAQTAFRRFPDEAQQDYRAAVKALRERFEPPVKKDMYAAELKVCRKEKSETWGDFGDAIKTLVDYAFPNLDPAAKEVIALNHYLSHLGNPQVEFAVNQHQPKSIVEAISFTIEAESYLLKPMWVSHVESEESVVPHLTRNYPLQLFGNNSAQ